MLVGRVGGVGGGQKKAEGNALMTALKTSMNIAAKDLAREDQPTNPGEDCGRFDLMPNICGAQARDSCVPSLLSSIRVQDPGAPWPHGGAAQPSLRPILGNHPVNPDESWRRFDLVPTFCGGQPADDGFRPHDSDRLEHRAENASAEREHDPISGTKVGLWHGTTQDDDLLAKNNILREERGAGLEDRTQCAQHGLEDFDKHRREMPTTRRSLDGFWVGLCSVRLRTEFLRRTGGHANGGHAHTEPALYQDAPAAFEREPQHE